MSIRLETRAGVADLPWTAGERGAASPPRHLGPNFLVVAGADLVDLALSQQAFVVAGRRRKGWLASALWAAGIAARLREKARWEHC